MRRASTSYPSPPPTPPHPAVDLEQADATRRRVGPPAQDQRRWGGVVLGGRWGSQAAVRVDAVVDDLFTSAAEDRAVEVAPLALRMRPRTLDEVVGQDHLLTPGSPLRRLVE